jgi:2-keto-4-pentenoate hydratase
MLAAALIALVAAAQAESGWVDRIVSAYRDRTPIESDADLTPAAAEAIQARVVTALRADHGRVFGYKAALTNPAARKRFNVEEPLLGTLLAGMILDNGARVGIDQGVNLFIEADLLVRVADPAINNVSTREQAFAAIDRVAAFLEIPDVIIQPGQPLTGPVLTAVNAGARFGVMGSAIGTDEIDMADLAGFKVRLLRNGETVAQNTGRALMGDPLDAVLWLAGEARRRGIRLEAGDWLSLGSLTAPVRAGPGERYRAVYEGLGDEPLEVTAEFVP